MKDYYQKTLSGLRDLALFWRIRCFFSVLNYTGPRNITFGAPVTRNFRRMDVWVYGRREGQIKFDHSEDSKSSLTEALFVEKRCVAHRAHWRRRGAPTRKPLQIRAGRRRNDTVCKYEPPHSHGRSARIDACDLAMIYLAVF